MTSQTVDGSAFVVGQDLIDLPYFQVAVWLCCQADGESNSSRRCSYRSQSNRRLTFILRLPTPCASCQCNSGATNSAVGKPHLSNPFELSPAPAAELTLQPVKFAKIDTLTAITSMSVMLPTSSKSFPIEMSVTKMWSNGNERRHRLEQLHRRLCLRLRSWYAEEMDRRRTEQ